MGQTALHHVTVHCTREGINTPLNYYKDDKSDDELIEFLDSIPPCKASFTLYILFSAYHGEICRDDGYLGIEDILTQFIASIDPLIEPNVFDTFSCSEVEMDVDESDPRIHIIITNYYDKTYKILNKSIQLVY